MKSVSSSLPLYLQLNADLLDISQLYAEFAEPYNLWECQLAILHCAGHPDNMLIETVWNNIIEEEMAQTAELFPPDRIKVITNKIVALGKLYSSSQKYFPIGKSPNYCHNNTSLFILFKGSKFNPYSHTSSLFSEYITKKLELISVQIRGPYEWVFRALVETGTSLPKVFEVYNK